MKRAAVLDARKAAPDSAHVLMLSLSPCLSTGVYIPSSPFRISLAIELAAAQTEGQTLFPVIVSFPLSQGEPRAAKKLRRAFKVNRASSRAASSYIHPAALKSLRLYDGRAARQRVSSIMRAVYFVYIKRELHAPHPF